MKSASSCWRFAGSAGWSFHEDRHGAGSEGGHALGESVEKAGLLTVQAMVASVRAKSPGSSVQTRDALEVRRR